MKHGTATADPPPLRQMQVQASKYSSIKTALMSIKARRK
jgi:hypothetical protein